MPLTSTTNLSGIQVTSMATEAYFESRQSFSLFTKKDCDPVLCLSKSKPVTCAW